MSRIITREADRQCPVRTYKLKHNKPCWLTNEIIEQMKDRDYFYQKAKQTNSEDDWNIAKFHRNQTNFNVRIAKAEYIKDQLRNNEGNSAKFWRTIKQVMPTKKGNNIEPRISIVEENGRAVEENTLANFMNEYFANMGKLPQTTSKVPSTDSTSFKTQNTQNKTQKIDPATPQFQPYHEEADKPFQFMPITRMEVERLLRKINISKSSGITFLSSKLLKDSFLALSDKLTYLFNLSLKQALFPDQ